MKRRDFARITPLVRDRESGLAVLIKQHIAAVFTSHHHDSIADGNSVKHLDYLPCWDVVLDRIVPDALLCLQNSGQDSPSAVVVDVFQVSDNPSVVEPDSDDGVISARHIMLVEFPCLPVEHAMAFAFAAQVVGIPPGQA